MRASGFLFLLEQGLCGICLMSALSAALGQIITIAIYLPGFFGQKHTLRFALPRGRWLAPALSALKAGMATSVQYLYQMIFFLVCNNLLIRLGGETAVAVFDVIQNTSYLILYLFEGTGRAMQPILSTYQGEHNRQGMRNTVRLGFTAGLTVGGALIALVELWPAGMCLLFGIAGSASEALACTALRLYGAGALFAGINILLCNYYQACENEKPSFLLETLRGAVLLIPLTFICYVLGLQRFWLLFLLTEAGSLAVFLLLGLGGRYKKAELPEERIFQRTILSNAEDVMDVCRELEAFCEVWGADMKQQMFSTMTVEELGMAILKHGFQGRTDGYLQLTAIMDESGVLEKWAHFTQMLEERTVFSVKIAEAVKAGVVAYVDDVRAFIPASQLSTEYVEKLEDWQGKYVETVIITADPEKKRLVLSGREVEKEKKEAQKKERMAQFKAGDVVEGTVDSMKPYGAFIKLDDGVDGLLHISQISTQRIKHPSAVLTEGQTVKAKILSAQEGKLSLSMKVLAEQQADKEEHETFDYKETGSVSTGLGDLLKGLKL